MRTGCIPLRSAIICCAVPYASEHEMQVPYSKGYATSERVPPAWCTECTRACAFGCIREP